MSRDLIPSFGLARRLIRGFPGRGLYRPVTVHKIGCTFVWRARHACCIKDASVFHWKWSLRQHRAPHNSFNSCKYLAPVDRLTEMNNESTMMMMPFLFLTPPTTPFLATAVNTQAHQDDAFCLSTNNYTSKIFFQPVKMTMTSFAICVLICVC